MISLKHFVELACLEAEDQATYVNYFHFVPPYGYQHLVEIYSHTYSSSQDLREGASIPQMP